MIGDFLVIGESLGLADTGGQVPDLHLPLGDGTRHAELQVRTERGERSTFVHLVRRADDLVELRQNGLTVRTSSSLHLHPENFPREKSGLGLGLGLKSKLFQPFLSQLPAKWLMYHPHSSLRLHSSREIPQRAVGISVVVLEYFRPFCRRFVKMVDIPPRLRCIPSVSQAVRGLCWGVSSSSFELFCGSLGQNG